MSRPEYIKDEHLEYLVRLRDSGITNMFGATPYLEEEFDYLSGQDAKNILIYWMKSFSD
jgi:hypothetical protein